MVDDQREDIPDQRWGGGNLHAQTQVRKVWTWKEVYLEFQL